MLEFAPSLDQMLFKVAGEGGNPPQYYIIREMTGTERDQYLNRNNKRVEANKVADFTDYQTDLLQACVFETVACPRNTANALCVSEDDWVTTGRRVPLETLRVWPASRLAKLYPLAQEMSGLGGGKKETPDDVKKD